MATPPSRDALLRAFFAGVDEARAHHSQLEPPDRKAKLQTLAGNLPRMIANPGFWPWFAKELGTAVEARWLGLWREQPWEALATFGEVPEGMPAVSERGLRVPVYDAAGHIGGELRAELREGLHEPERALVEAILGPLGVLLEQHAR